MNNADIGQLHNTNYGWKQAQSLLEQGKTDSGHIDWRQRRVIRQRQKTKGKGRIPTVCYKLWNETFDLLKKYRSEHERYCLLTKTGTSLWLRDGKRKDAIYDRSWKNLKSLTPKQLRAGGATILGHHQTFKLYIPQFLADSPRGIPDRHYVVPSQPQFDAAIVWLGKQLKVK